LDLNILVSAVTANKAAEPVQNQGFITRKPHTTRTIDMARPVALNVAI
jgi:hypothetical protein